MKKDKDERRFIKFTPLQRRLLNEVNRRHATELNVVLEEIAKEHSIDFDDMSIQYHVNREMTGFNLVKIPLEDKENKLNEKENGHSTEGEVSVENPVHGDKGDV